MTQGCKHPGRLGIGCGAEASWAFAEAKAPVSVGACESANALYKTFRGVVPSIGTAPLSGCLSEQPISRVLSRLWLPSAGGDHSSRPSIAAWLKQPTRSLMRGSRSPVWSCFRWGLPCLVCHQTSGALLPHPFTLTQRHVADRRFTFCGTFLRVTPTGR